MVPRAGFWFLCVCPADAGVTTGLSTQSRCAIPNQLASWRYHFLEYISSGVRECTPDQIDRSVRAFLQSAATLRLLAPIGRPGLGASRMDLCIRLNENGITHGYCLPFMLALDSQCTSTLSDMTVPPRPPLFVRIPETEYVLGPPQALL